MAALKKQYLLEGLCCGSCAAEIEREVGGLDGVSSASVDLASKTLSLKLKENAEPKAVAEQAGRIARRHGPGIVLRELDAGAAAGEGTGVSGRAKLRRAAVILAAALFAAGLALPLAGGVKAALFLASSLLAGGEVLIAAARSCVHGHVFDENFLMSVAVLGAFAVGEYAEGAAVMIFYRVGEYFEDRAVDRSKRSISALMDIRPDSANLKAGGAVRRVRPEEVAVGDSILVRPGEKIPLDGRVTEGCSLLDTSALTGESLPRSVEPGSEVLSGSVNLNGALTVEVTKEFGESTASKILDLVRNAGSRKARAENFITKFARYYTPAVVFSAVALAFLPPLLVPGAALSEWVHRALIFLVVSCPCALVLSVPLSFFGGIGGASRRGILVKGGNYLEALSRVDTVVFDKTGTLTRGSFEVTEVSPAEGWDRETLLDLAAHAELYSSHPIAASIRAACGSRPDPARVSGYEVIPGKGVRASVDGRAVLAGNAALTGMENAASPAAGTVVFLTVDGAYAGRIVIADEIKPDAAQAVQKLKEAGVRRTVMLTGDCRGAADRVARETGLDAACAELLPAQKVEKLEELSREAPAGGKIVFVGDGINDAPVLARADVGVAMGGIGSDAAIEAADVVLMTDEPSKLADAIRIARRTHSVVMQNVVFALGVKFAVLALAAFGAATMWEAVFADVGVALIAVLNSLRAGKPAPARRNER
jgi:Cd2+/Zn2+-exporting ATPase